MINQEIISLKAFFHDNIFKFYRMALMTQGKTMDDIFFSADGKRFWSKQAGANRLFGKKLNRLLKGMNGKKAKNDQREVS
jgi:hypothetical protein